MAEYTMCPKCFAEDVLNGVCTNCGYTEDKKKPADSSEGKSN